MPSEKLLATLTRSRAAFPRSTLLASSHHSSFPLKTHWLLWIDPTQEQSNVYQQLCFFWKKGTGNYRAVGDWSVGLANDLLLRPPSKMKGEDVEDFSNPNLVDSTFCKIYFPNFDSLRVQIFGRFSTSNFG